MRENLFDFLFFVFPVQFLLCFSAVVGIHRQLFFVLQHSVDGVSQILWCDVRYAFAYAVIFYDGFYVESDFETNTSSSRMTSTGISTFENIVDNKLILSNLNDSHQIFIAEMGANKRGDIREICNFVKPDIADSLRTPMTYPPYLNLFLDYII